MAATTKTRPVILPAEAKKRRNQIDEAVKQYVTLRKTRQEHATNPQWSTTYQKEKADEIRTEMLDLARKQHGAAVDEQIRLNGILKDARRTFVDELEQSADPVRAQMRWDAIKPLLEAGQTIEQILAHVETLETVGAVSIYGPAYMEAAYLTANGVPQLMAVERVDLQTKLNAALTGAALRLGKDNTPVESTEAEHEVATVAVNIWKNIAGSVDHPHSLAEDFVLLTLLRRLGGMLEYNYVRAVAPQHAIDQWSEQATDRIANGWNPKND